MKPQRSPNKGVLLHPHENQAWDSIFMIIVGFHGIGRPGTNRDGTSRCPFVPGQKIFLVPVSLCPVTRAGANILGQTPLSRNIPRQNFKNKNRFPVFLFFYEGYFVLGRDGTEEFVPGHLLLPLSRDKGTPGQEFFCPGTKGQWDVPVCPIRWKH